MGTIPANTFIVLCLKLWFCYFENSQYYFDLIQGTKHSPLIFSYVYRIYLNIIALITCIWV